MNRTASHFFTPKRVYVFLLCALFALAIADHMMSPVLSDISAPSDLGNACAPCGAPCKAS
jgi:hypothetical protein